MGMDGSLILDPLLPLPWLAALAVALVMVAAGGLWRRARGRWWRLGFALAAILALVNPLVLTHQRQTEPDIALLLIDDSASQTESGRLDQTLAAAEALKAQTKDDDSLIWRTRRLQGDTPAKANETRLFGALKNALEQEPSDRLAGVVIITDGLAHDQAQAENLQQLDAPVHALLSGDPAMRDRRLVVEQSPRFGVVGRPLEVEVRIDDGPGGDGTAPLIWWDAKGTRQQRQVPVGESVRLTITPEHAGENLVRLNAPALAGEEILFNNDALLRINGVRDRLRVLLVTGEPYPGERLWRDTLKADPAVDLVHFTILRLPSSRDTASPLDLSLIPFPTRQLFGQSLPDFNLVIFDRYTLRGVLDPAYLANLAAYVRQGGAVLAAVGPEFAQPYNLAASAFGAVLPAVPTGALVERGLRPRLTAKGRHHPVTAPLPGAPTQGGDEAAWGRWFRVIETQTAAGDVLMDAGGLPLLTLDRVEAGRIALLASDQLWLWGRGIDGGGPYRELIRRMAHWLMKEPDLEEEALRAQAVGDDIVITRQSMTPSSRPVTLTGPDGQSRDIALTILGDGRSQARAAVDRPGIYSIDDGEHQTSVAAGAMDSPELRALRPSAEALAPLARATGGGLFWLRDGIPELRRISPARQSAGPSWMGLAERGSGPVSGVRETPLVPPWATLGLLLGLLAGAWLRESR
ncbi:MAG: hypothetical protein Tsb0016_26280 [Sphingomonadales bacterium]